jgi:O-antigen ligase
MRNRTSRKNEPTTPLDAGPAPLAGRFLFVSLCGSIAFETLFFWTRVGNAYTVPKFVAVLVGGAVLLPQVCFLLLNDPPRPRLLFVLFAFQLIAITGATVNSMSSVVSFWGGDWRRMGWIAQFAMIATAIAAPLAIRDDFSRWKRLLQFVAAVGAISAAYGILQSIGWDPFLPSFLRDRIILDSGGVYRSFGTLGQPTYYATYLLYPFFAALTILVSEAGAKRIFAGGAMTVIVVAISSSGTRGGLLGCAAGLGVFAAWVLLSRLRLADRSVTWIAAVLCIGLLLGVWGLSSAGNVPANAELRLPGMKFLESRLANAGTDSASIGRIVLWRDVFQRILPKVWLSGTGPGMFRVAFTRYRSNSYAQFGPDVHWENAHNLFLDRFTEQGVLGLVAIIALIAAFVHNIVSAVHRTADRKRAAGYAAFGAGLAAVLVSHSFNGELITTTYYFYLWIAISFACHTSIDRRVRQLDPNGRTPGPLPTGVFLGTAIGISIGLVWYAECTWHSETMLRAGEEAMNSGDWRALLTAKKEAESATPHVGTYHLEFAGLIVTLLTKPHQVLDAPSRRLLVEAGFASAQWAVERTDRPMLALLHMVVLSEMLADARSESWIQNLKDLDPYWFRTHEISARFLLRHQRLGEGLKEATIAHELAPFVDSSTNLWRELLVTRRGPDYMPAPRD